MKKFFMAALLIVFYLSFTLMSCRPPWLEGAIVHLNAGRDDQAYNLLAEGTQKEPGNAEGWYYLGKMQGKKGMVQEMLESFSKSLKLDTSRNEEEEILTPGALTSFCNCAII